MSKIHTNLRETGDPLPSLASAAPAVTSLSLPSLALEVSRRVALVSCQAYNVPVFRKCPSKGFTRVKAALPATPTRPDASARADRPPLASCPGLAAATQLPQDVCGHLFGTAGGGVHGDIGMTLVQGGALRI